MQIRVKLFLLNENAAKHLHLHLDPCQLPSHHTGYNNNNNNNLLLIERYLQLQINSALHLMSLNIKV